MKVLSLHQPYASLIFLTNKQTGQPIKRFETRPSPPNGDMRPEGVRGIPGCRVDRGDIIGIASTQNTDAITADGLTEGGWAYTYFGADGEYQAGWCFRTSDEGSRGDTFLEGPGIEIEDQYRVMPLGCLLGTVRVVDAYPIDDDLAPTLAASPLGNEGAIHRNGRDGTLSLWRELSDGIDCWQEVTDLSDQLPYGDWEPGRWAIELADPTPFDEPVPVKGRQGVWEWTP